MDFVSPMEGRQEFVTLSEANFLLENQKLMGLAGYLKTLVQQESKVKRV